MLPPGWHSTWSSDKHTYVIARGQYSMYLLHNNHTGVHLVSFYQDGLNQLNNCKTNTYPCAQKETKNKSTEAYNEEC